MTTDLDQLRDELLESIDVAPDLPALETVRVGALGKKGSISQRMQDLGGLPPSERRTFGQHLNLVKSSIADAIDAKRTQLEAAQLDAKLSDEAIDVSLPVRPAEQGRLHPITQTIDEAVAILGEMGFVVAEGPEIEDDFHNFTALNIPPEHPARQMHDTFYLPEKEDGSRPVLRTHTSPVQIRTLEAVKPPLRVIAPGRTYRCDSDMTHTPMFHQIEGLVIDKESHFGHLKGCLLSFLEAFFEVEDLPLRFRPSFFPFTEPSAEADIGCSRDGGEIQIGGGQDWLEILGCGMVHNNVLSACGVDPDEYQGFAFGLGVERMAMLKYGIPDLRTFFDADLRWLKHHGFMPLEIPSLVRGLS